MTEEYNQILEVVAENPGATGEKITNPEFDHSIPDTDIPDLLSEAITNEDLLEFDDRYWVMRTDKYPFNRHDHPET